MWLFIFFDIPASTASQKKKVSQFRRELLKQSFTMLQYSIYIKHCMSYSDIKKWEKRIIKVIPKIGKIYLLKVRDKEYETIESFLDGKKNKLFLPRPDEYCMIF